jgi:hypothetical protein
MRVSKLFGHSHIDIEMNISTLLYKQYPHLATDDLKIDTETSYGHVLLQVSLQVSLHASLRHTEWAQQVAPRMSVDTLTVGD